MPSEPVTAIKEAAKLLEDQPNFLTAVARIAAALAAAEERGRLAALDAAEVMATSHSLSFDENDTAHKACKCIAAAIASLKLEKP